MPTLIINFTDGELAQITAQAMAEGTDLETLAHDTVVNYGLADRKKKAMHRALGRSAELLALLADQ